MGEHRHPGLSLGPKYVEKQNAFRGRARRIAASPDLSADRVMVRWQTGEDGKENLVPVPCPPAPVDLDKKIRKAIADRLRVGLGKADRIERKAAR